MSGWVSVREGLVLARYGKRDLAVHGGCWRRRRQLGGAAVFRFFRRRQGGGGEGKAMAVMRRRGEGFWRELGSGKRNES